MVFRIKILPSLVFGPTPGLWPLTACSSSLWQSPKVCLLLSTFLAVQFHFPLSSKYNLKGFLSLLEALRLHDFYKFIAIFCAFKPGDNQKMWLIVSKPGSLGDRRFQDWPNLLGSWNYLPGSASLFSPLKIQ